MKNLEELLKNVGWMIHDLRDSDQIDNEEEEHLINILESAKQEFELAKEYKERWLRSYTS